MLKLENYKKSFGELQVLKGVDLKVNRGEVIAVIGPSGSGKSTLIKTINQLVTPDSGKMTFNNKSFNASKVKKRDLQAIRKKMGMVFQNFGLFNHLTVLENLTIVLEKVNKYKKNDAKSKAIDILTSVGLKDKLNAYPAQLSGGQQQRVGIARALVAEPDILLFDEPTSALDPELIGEVLKVIKSLAHEGNTMIIVTHEMSFAKEVADRIIFMDDGKILVDDTPDNVFNEDTHPRVRYFLSRFIGKDI